MTWTELCKSSHGDILTWAESQPWCQAMAACQQDAGWHSEGDVWTHTQMVFRLSSRCSKIGPVLLFMNETILLLLTGLVPRSRKTA